MTHCEECEKLQARIEVLELLLGEALKLSKGDSASLLALVESQRTTLDFLKLKLSEVQQRRDRAKDALVNLTFMARTAPGTAADAALGRACDAAEAVIGQKVPSCAKRKPDDQPASTH